MKLYFYFLDVRKDNCIRMEECEVEEKGMVYLPMNKFPEGYSSDSVWSMGIGQVTGEDGKVIILTENNPLIAADTFERKYQYDMKRLMQSIWAKRQQMEETNNILLSLWKWRSENAGE